MKKNTLFISFILAISICFAQTTPNYTTTSSNTTTTNWEEINLGSNSLEYMFSANDQAAMFNVKWGATSFVIDKTRNLDVITTDGNIVALRIVKYHSVIKKDKNTGRQFAESTDLSYTGRLDILKNNVVRNLRFYTVAGDNVDVILTADNGKKISSLYTQLNQTQQSRLDISYVTKKPAQTIDFNQNNSVAVYSADASNLSASQILDDYTNEQAKQYQTESYKDVVIPNQKVTNKPIPVFDNKTITACDPSNPNFGDACLVGKQRKTVVNKKISSNSEPYAQSVQKIIPVSVVTSTDGAGYCDLSNPKFGDACFKGKVNQSQVKNNLKGGSDNQSSSIITDGAGYCDLSHSKFGDVCLKPKEPNSPKVKKEEYLATTQKIKRVGSNTISATELYPIIAAEPMIQSNNAPLSVANPIVGQSQIENNKVAIDGFWGAKFGLASSEMVDHLINTNRIKSKDIISANRSSVLLKDVNFNTINYDNATLVFNSNRMSSGLFVKNYTNAVQQASRDINAIQNGLSGKYGQPTIKSNAASTHYYWYDNQNSRSIILEVKSINNNDTSLDLHYLDKNLANISTNDVDLQSSNYSNLDY